MISICGGASEKTFEPGKRANQVDALPAGSDVRASARFLERGLRGGEARQRHAERRAADVVEAELVAEGDAPRLAAVLAADAQLELRFDTSPPLDGDAHQVADAVEVDHLERVALEHTVLEVARQELPLRVVARERERRLRQIVRAEGEEVGDRRDLVGAQRRAWH